MKFTLLQSNLSEATQTAVKLINVHAQLPILSNFKLTAAQNELSLKATNLERSINITLGAKIETPGEITVPAKEFTEIISHLPKAAISFEVAKEKLKLTTDSVKLTLNAAVASEFPEIPSSVSKSAFPISSTLLEKMLSKVLFSVSLDESRPILTGVLFEISKGHLDLVATDGFRLVKIGESIDKKSLVEARVIVPKSTLLDLSKIVKNSKETFIDIQTENKQILFLAGNTTYSSRVIEGAFPDYQKIIPQKETLTIAVSKNEFAQSIKTAAVFVRVSGNVVKLFAKKDSLEVAAKSSQLGSQSTTLDAKVKGLEGETFEISYNYRFLDEFLSIVEADEVSFGFTNQFASGIFIDPSQPNLLHIIMPVKA